MEHPLLGCMITEVDHRSSRTVVRIKQGHFNTLDRDCLVKWQRSDDLKRVYGCQATSDNVPLHHYLLRQAHISNEEGSRNFAAVNGPEVERGVQAGGVIRVAVGCNTNSF